MKPTQPSVLLSSCWRNTVQELMLLQPTGHMRGRESSQQHSSSGSRAPRVGGGVASPESIGRFQLSALLQDLCGCSLTSLLSTPRNFQVCCKVIDDFLIGEQKGDMRIFNFQGVCQVFLPVYRRENCTRYLSPKMRGRNLENALICRQDCL